MKREKVLIAVIVTLVLVIAGPCFYSYQQRSDLEILRGKYSALQEDYATLQEDYTSLKQSYESLASQYDLLSSNYSALQLEHASLETGYASLQSEYSSLESEYSLLQSEYSFLESEYETLDSQYSDFRSAYALLVTSVNERTMPYDVTVFITPRDSSVSQIVSEVTGGWSNPSDWNEFWSDVKSMYDWVVSNIEYRSDGYYPILPDEPTGEIRLFSEMWQLPNETLNLTQGDCEDMAILLCSMILSYTNGEHYTECIDITGAEAGHIAVQIPVGEDEITILDPAGHYYTSDSWGDITSKDISTEVNDWLDYWKPKLGSDVYVRRVFSDTLVKEFSSTNEYTSWMYTR